MGGCLVLASEPRWDKGVPTEKQFHVGFYSLRGGERDSSKARAYRCVGANGSKVSYLLTSLRRNWRENYHESSMGLK